MFNTDVVSPSGLDPTLETCIRHMNVSTDINELIKINGNIFSEIATCVLGLKANCRAKCSVLVQFLSDAKGGIKLASFQLKKDGFHGVMDSLQGLLMS